MKVLLLSDNHGRIDNMQKILETYTYDVAIHLGDGMVDLDYLAKHFDYYVCGNHEHWLPQEKIIKLGGLKMLIMHGHTKQMQLIYNHLMSKWLKTLQVDLVIHGHTHTFKDIMMEGKRVICPGSTDYPRGPEGKGFVMLEIKNQKIISVEFVGIYD